MRNHVVNHIQSNARPWICALLLFVISYPKWLWGMSQDVITIASLLLLLIAFADISKNRNSWNAGLIVLFIQIIFLGNYFILSNTNLSGYAMVFIRGVGYASIFLCSTDFWKKTVDCFIIILALLLIPTIIEHILITFLDQPTTMPYATECPINPERDYDVYIFNTYIVRTFDVSARIRFSAFYDEAGVVGNIMMVLLYLQKFNFKKWYNIVLLISGILSFSLTFFFAVFAYYIIYGDIKLKISFLVVLALSVLFFYNNEFVYDLVFGRLEFEDGQLAGYNREIHTDINTWLKHVPLTDFLFWGYQPRESIPYAASWKWAFVLYGIIPSLMYLFFLVFPRVLYIRKGDLLLGLMLVTIIWIQRPFLQLYIYTFLLAIPFIYFSDSNNKRKYNVQSKHQSHS